MTGNKKHRIVYQVILLLQWPTADWPARWISGIARLGVVLLLLALGPLAQGSPSLLVPEAPVKNFALPQFAPEGHREWLLRGQRGIFTSDGRLRIEGLLLDVFSPNDPLEPQFQIASPEATIEPSRRLAAGPAYLQLLARDGSFRLTGRDWRWHGAERILTVRQSVEVTFAQSLGTILTVTP